MIACTHKHATKAKGAEGLLGVRGERTSNVEWGREGEVVLALRLELVLLLGFLLLRRNIVVII